MQKRVLVIDDDAAIRELVSDILTSEGYYVIERNSAEAGLEKLLSGSKSKDNKFDIIVCDIMMPGATGFEVLKKIKRSKKIEVPIFIFVTASKERSDLRTAMESGADDFITKPFTAEELLKAVKVQEAKKEKIEDTLLKNILDSKKRKPDEVTSKVKLSVSQKFKSDDKLFISNVNNSGFVYIKDIVLIKSLKDYTKIYTGNKESYIVRKPLKRWLSSLPEESFQLVNRSEIVNVNSISELIKLPNSTHEIILNNCTQKVTISRRISIQLKSQLKSL
ncbi:MAG: LytR/AlgR family response regulator transcription factor [Ignavibacteria bacterium]